MNRVTFTIELEIPEELEGTDHEKVLLELENLCLSKGYELYDSYTEEESIDSESCEFSTCISDGYDGILGEG